MFSTTKLTPLKVFSWKFLNCSLEQRDVDVDARAVEFRAHFIGVDELGLEAQILQVDRAEGQAGAIEVEAARLIAAREAGVGQQLVGRLVAQDRGAGELVLLFASAAETAVDRVERARGGADRRQHLVGERACKRGNGGIEPAIAAGSAAAAAASA